MPLNDNSMPSLHSSLYDHDRKGAEILLVQPSRLLLALNLTILGALVAALIWACFAKADVIVTAVGTLEPKQELNRVFPPVDGELHGIYVESGAPVQAGDIIARINARGAVQAASKAQESQLKLAEVREEYDRFPAKRALLRQQAEGLKSQLSREEAELARRRTEGLSGVNSAQRARLDQARSQLEQSIRGETSARLESEKFERLVASPGGGGVSATQVRQKKDAFLDAQDKRRSNEAQLATLEFEVNQAIAKADKDFTGLAQQVSDLQVRYATAVQKVANEESRLNFRLRSAELEARAAERLSFENFDEDNFLKIYAPVSGIVTEVASRQTGAKVQAGQSIVSIAPADAERIVSVRIAEKDRGFLQTGQSVKLKFNAFPYRTYGSLAGTLEYLSPTATRSQNSEESAYLGRVSLEQDSVRTPQGDITLSYGMNAIVELVVRERRFIDLALDPVRGLTR